MKEQHVFQYVTIVKTIWRLKEKETECTIKRFDKVPADSTAQHSDSWSKTRIMRPKSKAFKGPNQAQGPDSRIFAGNYGTICILPKTICQVQSQNLIWS